MRKHCCLFLVLILATALASIAETPVVDVQLGETTLKNSVQLLRFGNIASGMESLAVLDIHRQPSGAGLRVFCEGPFVFCRWLDRMDRTDRVSAGGRLEVRLAPSISEPEPNFVIIADEQGKPITLVMVDFQLFDKSKAQLVLETPPLVSGLGKGWGPWYDVCSGPAPPGYAFLADSDNFSVEGPDRGCGSWVNCERTQRDSSNVCWKFQIQGREAVFLKNPHETVKGVAKLTLTWELIASKPVLEPVEPQKEATQSSRTISAPAYGSCTMIDS